MNNFTTKKIRPTKPVRAPIPENVKRHISTALGLVLCAVLIYYTGLFVMEKVGGIELLHFLSGIFGKNLVTDEQGHTNVLLLGVGGEGHDGGDLTDSIMIASISQHDSTVTLLSVPRDLYVTSTLGGRRINELYYQAKIKWGPEQALDFTRDTMAKLFHVSLQYVVKVDFKAFAKVIDSIGGVDVYVDREINDPFYPLAETHGFETFILAKGQQHLDGATALKYARSRETTSDFDRSKRQQKLLVAIKTKVKDMSSGERSSLLKDLYSSLSEDVETNMSIREMLSLGDFGAHWDSRQLNSAMIHDDPSQPGGFLYTPAREFYAGAFVLLPAGDTFESVDRFISLLFYGTVKEYPIVVLNGTKEGGLAGSAAAILNRFGFVVSHTANAVSKKITTTSWYLIPDANPASTAPPELLLTLQKIIPATFNQQLPDTYKNDPRYAGAKIILEVGSDMTKEIPKLNVPLPPPEPVASASKSAPPSSLQIK